MKKILLQALFISFLICPSTLLADETIIDNSDAAFSTAGKWKAEDSGYMTSSYTGNDFLVSKDKHAEATWNVSNSEGEFELFVMYASSYHFSSSAVYEVHHAGGVTTSVVNQSRNGGLWHSIGTFKGLSKVVLVSGNSNGSISADAIKLVEVEEEEDEPVICAPSNDGGSGGGYFANRKAYFAGGSSYKHPTVNYFCRSILFISNITTEKIDVTVNVYDASGNLVLDDGSPESGRIVLQTQIPTEYAEEGPISLTLSPRQSVKITMKEGSNGSYDLEQGEVSWTPQNGNSSLKVALMASRVVYCDEYGVGTKQSRREATLNSGLPF